MTPAEVRDARHRHRASTGDIYGTTGLVQIVISATETGRIAAECISLQVIADHLPEFVDACGYRWMTDAESYDLAAEVAFQRRALFMLGKLWAETEDRTALASSISRIIAAQEFVTNFGLCSPRLSKPRAPHNHRILSIPAGFVELALWYSAGLRCWIARQLQWADDQDEDGGWTLVCSPVPQRDPRPFAHVSAYELIARTLAESGRDRKLLGGNAALLIREQIPELSGISGDIDSTALPYFDQNAAYMLVEFAIAHELGHALSESCATPPTSEELAEESADRIGCFLLQISAGMRTFGWGQDQLLGLTQATLGVALFEGLIATRTCLIDGLLRRPSINGSRNARRLLQQEQLRVKVAQRTRLALLTGLAASALEDQARIQALMNNSEAFVRDLATTIMTLPDAAITRAIHIAERAVE